MRLRIVETLRHGEHAVNDLVEKVEIQQSGVSRHLRILQEAGFVRVRPEGQKRLYSLRPEPFRKLDAWIGGFRGALAGPPPQNPPPLPLKTPKESAPPPEPLTRQRRDRHDEKR